MSEPPSCVPRRLPGRHDGPHVVRQEALPTILFPTSKDRAAMHVNGGTVLSRVTVDDVVAESVGWSLDGSVARSEAVAIVAAMAEALDDLPEQLAAVVRDRADRFR